MASAAMSVNGQAVNSVSDATRASVGKRKEEKINLHVC